MNVYREEELEWTPHPVIGVERKILISKKKHEVDVTCMLVRIPKGVEISEHIHDAQDDIIYVLQGSFKLRAEGADYNAEKGTLLRVPKGIKHMIHDVREDTLLYDVFVPATL
ncbi:MAG: cupin domain-containing protein [Desulfobacteraceae bacterium]|jgi:quercetin dioxygenase-like cupin family protein|nr:cupin domain-containing protein [Desulfobacteraceae bacterium]